MNRARRRDDIFERVDHAIAPNRTIIALFGRVLHFKRRAFGLLAKER